MECVVVGAYATSPPSGVDADEAEFYEALRACGITGFEVPLFRLTDGSIAMHARDETLLLDRMCSGSPTCVVSCIPATMVCRGSDAAFGLASDSASGRAAALDLARSALAAVARLRARGCSVVAVEVHACGPPGASSVASFTASLGELTSWDWHGATLVVEHCDTNPRDGSPPRAKGFPLTFAEELAAVRAANAAAAPPAHPVGVAVNWARSVLETRNAAAAVQHARDAGALLRGIVFSGCSGAPEHSGYGAWADSHMPHAAAAAGSLLTPAAIADTLAAAAAAGARLLFTGCKVTLQPPSASPAERAAVNAELLGIIAEARATAAEASA